MSSFATAVGVGLLGVLAGVPARPVSSACPVHQQRLRPGGVTRYRAGHGAAVVRGHPAPRRPGLGLGGRGLPGLGVRLPGAGGDRRRHRAAAQPHHLPGVPGVAGLLLAASLGLGELGRLGRGLLAAASVGGLFLPLALLSPHGMGWAAR